MRLAQRRNPAASRRSRRRISDRLSHREKRPACACACPEASSSSCLGAGVGASANARPLCRRLLLPGRRLSNNAYGWRGAALGAAAQGAWASWLPVETCAAAAAAPAGACASAASNAACSSAGAAAGASACVEASISSCLGDSTCVAPSPASEGRSDASSPPHAWPQRRRLLLPGRTACPAACISAGGAGAARGAAAQVCCAGWLGTCTAAAAAPTGAGATAALLPATSSSLSLVLESSD